MVNEMSLKNFYQIIIVLALGLFSFFYTDKVIDFIRNSDPIMKSIKKESTSHNVDPINAKVKDNKIIPGVSGLEVDYDSSYKKMKKYGTYNESLTVFKEVEPTISVDDYYDKYISQGSGINNDVAVVFVVNQGDDIKNILNTLTSTNTRATFFVDGLWLENNRDLATSMAEEGYELEILNYNGRYEQLYFNSSLNLVKSITNLEPKYCYAEYDSKEVLELCSSLKLHTIIPTILTNNYPFSNVKQKLAKGSIISFDIINSTEIELLPTINYIKQKGYVLDTLDNLLSEAVDVK